MISLILRFTTIIGVLTVTAISKLTKELNKDKIAKFQHKSGLIRSKISIESNFFEETDKVVSPIDNNGG